MRRSHRKAHFYLWMILGPATLIGLILGIVSRREMPVQKAPYAQELPQSAPPAEEITDR